MNSEQIKAWRAGYFDAINRREYRHSAPATSRIRNWLLDYEDGWNHGRTNKRPVDLSLINQQ